MKQVKTSAVERERFWHHHFEQWRRSEMSQRAYCLQESVALSTFQLWRRRLRASVAEPCFDIVPLPRSARVDLSPLSQRVVLIIGAGHYRLEVAEGARVETIRVVLDALEGH